MCGIIGYIGERPAAPILLQALQHLEYRGYDSAGIALLTERGEFAVRKTVGKLSALRSLLKNGLPSGTRGIGHTRWATHGKPNLENAHPHIDCKGEILVIHNGIVENYRELKRELVVQGHTFLSQTDTEVLPHLIETYLSRGCYLEEAVRQTLARLGGSHALIAMSKAEPGKMVAARLGNAGGLVVGYGQGEMFVASDLPALLPHAHSVIFLSNSEIATLSPGGVSFSTMEGTYLEKTPQDVPYPSAAAAKGGYPHFMLKEIMEQPEVIADTLRGRVKFDPPDVCLTNLPLSSREVKALKRISLVACGTSVHAALIGKFMLEELTRLPVEVDYGSEFRYRNPPLSGDTLLIAITQSGETADTLAAVEEGRDKGARLLTICNVPGSQVTRLAEGVIFTRSGLEMGVASTKTFTGQLVALYLLAARLGKTLGTIGREKMSALMIELMHLPHLVGRLLERDDYYQSIAQRFFRFSNFLYLGRGVNYPVALEGALKLKEISYIHAEGYPAGEMKHGPIALVDENMPVVAIALSDRISGKMAANIEQIKAREGKVIALVTEGEEEIAAKADCAVYIPPTSHLLAPVLAVVPLQLLAYHIAVLRGCDVDQPRNLAKSVTVE